MKIVEKGLYVCDNCGMTYFCCNRDLPLKCKMCKKNFDLLDMKEKNVTIIGVK